MEIITRGQFCNIHLPLCAVEVSMLTSMAAAGDDGIRYRAAHPAPSILALYNLHTRGFVEVVTPVDLTVWHYRITQRGKLAYYDLFRRNS